MDNGNNERNDEMEQKKGKRQKPQFNAGGNASDYDGGHPAGSFSEEEASEESEDQGAFNAGHNDSDYDGGHPGESFRSKK